MSNKFFPPRPNAIPKIYCYELINVPSHAGLIKVSYTTREVEQRIKEHLGTSKVKYKILLDETAMRNDATSFTDHEVHSYLRKQKFKNTEGEWYECKVKDVKAAILAIKTGELNVDNRTLDFKM